MTLEETNMRTAPVQPYREWGHKPRRNIPFPIRVPWVMHERAWSSYAAAGHGRQSAERVAERGGFGVLEFVACLTIGYGADYMLITDEMIAKVRDEAEGLVQLHLDLAAAKNQARLGWERAAENDHAYGEMIVLRDAAAKLHLDDMEAIAAELNQLPPKGPPLLSDIITAIHALKDATPWGYLDGDGNDPNFGRACGVCLLPIRRGGRYAHVCRKPEVRR